MKKHSQGQWQVQMICTQLHLMSCNRCSSSQTWLHSQLPDSWPAAVVASVKCCPVQASMFR